MKKKTKTIKVGTLNRGFTFLRETVNIEARTAELSFSSEEPYERYWGQEILGHKPEECRLERLNNGGALLCDHNTRDQIGVIEKAYIDQDRKGRVTMTGSDSVRSNKVSFCEVLKPTAESAVAATGARGDVRTLS